MSNIKTFEAQDFDLQGGVRLPSVQLRYATMGTLSPARDNVVLIPSWYSGTHRESALCLVGEGRAIDPARHFIVLTNLLSNGVSSSPSNTAGPFEASRFPRVTLHDNIRLQHALLTDHLGIERLKLVAGWSMGGCQAYQWGAWVHRTSATPVMVLWRWDKIIASSASMSGSRFIGCVRPGNRCK
jgi:homoserine O-acetyltransferase/O-succinyltransferase